MMKTVGVVGVGRTACVIAQVCALTGMQVRWLDTGSGVPDQARVRLGQALARCVQRGRLNPQEMNEALAHVDVLHAMEGLRGCELVVDVGAAAGEAARQLFTRLEAAVDGDCILVSTNPSLSVSVLASACAAPARVGGWHVFDPVVRTRLAEVVRGPQTSARVVDELVQLSRRLGQRPIVVSDSPGFVVEQMRQAFEREGAVLLAGQAASRDVLNGVLRTCGRFRVGPFGTAESANPAQALADADRTGEAPLRWAIPVGPLGLGAASREVLDICGQETGDLEAEVLFVDPLVKSLSATVGAFDLDPARTLAIDPLFSGPQGVTLMHGQAVRPDLLARVRGAFAAAGIPCFLVADTPGYVVPRVVAGLVNLACGMAQRGIAEPDDIDVAACLALGCPQGPFAWADRLGLAQIERLLDGLHRSTGDPRYQAAPWLRQCAKLGLPLGTPARRFSVAANDAGGAR